MTKLPVATGSATMPATVNVLVPATSTVAVPCSATPRLAASVNVSVASSVPPLSTSWLAVAVAGTAPSWLSALMLSLPAVTVVLPV